MKICSKCKVSKLEEDFSRYGTGLRYWCRECEKVYRTTHNTEARKEAARVYTRRWNAAHKTEKAEYHQQYYLLHRDEWREYSRQHLREHIERNQRWRAANPERVAACMKRWRVANPEKVRANWALREAIRKGEIIKPSICEMCGADDRPLDGHHEDHSLPLEAKWYCHSCHMGLNRIPIQEAA